MNLTLHGDGKQMGAYPSFIAGLSYRSKAELKVLATASKNDLLKVVREPDNRHDENAIALFWKDVHVGYVPARHAEWLAERIDRGGFVEVYVTDVETSGWLMPTATSAGLLLVTNIDDAPEGTESAQLADKRAAEQVVAAEQRALLDATVERFGPAATEIVALLRWVGRIADGPSEKKERLIDDCLRDVLMSANVTVTDGLLARLRRPASILKGSDRRAEQAIERIVSEKSHVQIVSQAVLDMVRLDGVVSKEEEEIVRRYLELARRALGK